LIYLQFLPSWNFWAATWYVDIFICSVGFFDMVILRCHFFCVMVHGCRKLLSQYVPRTAQPLNLSFSYSNESTVHWSVSVLVLTNQVTKQHTEQCHSIAAYYTHDIPPPCTASDVSYLYSKNPPLVPAVGHMTAVTHHISHLTSRYLNNSK
jgi:hypothetical protein